MSQNNERPDNGVNISGIEGNLSIGGNVVGRDNISIGNVTIEQFVLGGLPPERQLEFFIRNMGLEHRQARYESSQDKAYCDVWRSLQALRLAGNDLWEKATTENVADFSMELRKTELVVREGEIFFEENDRTELLSLLQSLGKYRLGKLRLIEIRSKEEVENYGGGPRELNQIQENRIFKDDYEHLLERVRQSFKIRLSNKPL